MSSNRPKAMVDWVKLLQTTFGMGRNSEHGATKFSDIGWDTLLECVDIGWKEQKTKKHYGMAMMNYHNPDHYMICFKHAMASVFVADKDLLIRTKGDKNKDFLQYYYYDCKNNKASNAGKQLTNMIRNNLPAGIPKKT